MNEDTAPTIPPSTAGQHTWHGDGHPDYWTHEICHDAPPGECSCEPSLEELKDEEFTLRIVDPFPMHEAGRD